MVRALRAAFPNAQIDFAIKSQFADLMRHNPHINNLLVFEKELGIETLQDKIKHENYDHIVDIHKNLRSSIIKLSSKASSSTYPKYIFRRTLLVKFGINYYKHIEPVYIRYFKAVKQFGVAYDNGGTEVFYSSADAVKVNTAITNVGLSSSDKIIVICPAASYTNKQWLPDRFAELADQFVNQGYNVVFHGGEKDINLCNSIKQMMKRESVSFAGKFSLLESAVLLKTAKLAITNDSGMMHLAQSQKTSVVAIFGPTTKELGYFPFPERSQVVEKKVSCRPCTHNGLNYCPKKHFRCMTDIEVDDVEKAAKILLMNLS